MCYFLQRIALKIAHLPQSHPKNNPTWMMMGTKVVAQRKRGHLNKSKWQCYCLSRNLRKFLFKGGHHWQSWLSPRSLWKKVHLQQFLSIKSTNPLKKNNFVRWAAIDSRTNNGGAFEGKTKDPNNRRRTRTRYARGLRIIPSQGENRMWVKFFYSLYTHKSIIEEKEIEVEWCSIEKRVTNYCAMIHHGLLLHCMVLFYFEPHKETCQK